jgi:hypothetical protein
MGQYNSTMEARGRNKELLVNKPDIIKKNKDKMRCSNAI